MKTRGRPCKDDAKKNKYLFRMDDRERAMLDFLSEKTGRSIADIIRNGIRMYYNLEKYRD